VRNVKRSIDDEKIVVIVKASPLIRDRSLCVASHAARACLMLSSAQNQTGLRAPHFLTATCTQPLFATLAHELRRVDRRSVGSAAEPRDRNSPLVAHTIVDCDPSFR